MIFVILGITLLFLVLVSSIKLMYSESWIDAFKIVGCFFLYVGLVLAAIGLIAYGVGVCGHHPSVPVEKVM